MVIERRYYRIPSIVPVDFQLLSADNEPLEREIRTAFTRDLSEAGLCLEIHSLPAAIAARVEDQSAPIGIQIDIDLPKRSLRIPARVAWRRQESVGGKQHHLLGLEFRGITETDQQEIAAFAKRAARRPKIIRAAVVSLGVLLCAAAGLYVWQTRVYEEKLADSHQVLSQTKQKYEGANDRLGDMQVELRWLAVRTGELVDMLEDQKGREPGKEQAIRPVLGELSDNLEKLRALIIANKKAKE